MDRKSYFSQFNLNYSSILLFFWILSITLHLGSFITVINNQQFLLNDSVIYLTIAENFKNFKVISQSFYEPIIPDFQRSPLYPVILSYLPVNWVLILQHLFILFTGYFIQRLSIFIQSEQKYVHFLGVLFTLMPYSINLPSFIMSESIFILFLSLTGFFLILFLVNFKWVNLFFLAIFSVLASYTRASMLPFILVIVGLVFYYSQSISKTIFLLIIIVMGLFPWFYRNYTYTGQWFFTSMSQISMYYGRIGGTTLSFQSTFGDSELKVEADQYVSSDYSLEKIKKYHQNVINEENEFIQIPLLKIYFQQHIVMPLHSLIFHFRCIYQQFTGLSYGMTIYLYQSKFLAWIGAFFQGIMIIMVYGGFFFIGMSKEKIWKWNIWLISLFFWLIIHNAAWADGRYRWVTDLWGILGIVFLHVKNHHPTNFKRE